MNAKDLISHRLINQQIASTAFTKAEELVDWMIAIQSQDWNMAKWGIGLRLQKLVEADVEKAFNDGLILRTHVMRPTWHFVTPKNIRWLLALTAPRVKAFIAYYDRQLELDNKIFKRSNDTLAKILGGNNYLVRSDIEKELAKQKIKATGQRLGHLLIHAELDAVICSGPRKGKQFTYALLDEKAPVREKFDRAKSLAELTRQYFTSRGPATVQDFAWWSGLSIAEGREGVAMLKSKLEQVIINGQEYLWIPASLSRPKRPQSTFLLPDYDEYGISYKDRSAIFDEKNKKGLSRDGNIIFNHMIVINGVTAGTWQRKLTGKKLAVETALFTEVNKTQKALLDKAVKKYVSFFDQPV